MIPKGFEYHAPASLAEAAALLHKYKDDAKILSGGQSLIPLMKLRFAEPKVIVDINGIKGLNYVDEKAGNLRIGALARESDLEDSKSVQKKFPMISDAVKMIADPSVRNRATLCGNLAHGDPANDQPAIMLALNAQMVVQGRGKERLVPASKFFVGTLATALKQDEILKEVRIPLPPANSGGAYLKLERRVGDFAIVAVAAQIGLDRGGKIASAGIGLTNVGPTPIKATAAEQFLVGKDATDANFAEAARLAEQASSPSSDNRAPADYKRAMVKELAVRALRRALERAKGGK
jgi:carbon-monoxide dehydrogenase medium subunit